MIFANLEHSMMIKMIYQQSNVKKLIYF